MAARWLVAISVTATAFLAFAGFRTMPPDGMPASARPHSYELLQEEARHLLAKGAFLLKELTLPPRIAWEDRTAAVARFFSLEQRSASREASARGSSSRVGLQQQLLEQTSFSDETASLTMEELKQLAEGALEGQVSAILAEQGLAFSLPALGVSVPFPPVQFTLETPPSLLITSPRDRIRLRATWVLRSSLGPEEMAAIEEQAETAGVSALVEPLGGLALYPSIVRRGAALRTTLAAIAHEWIHHYLYFYPLGRGYGSTYEMTTLNEMVATIAGNEIGDAVYRRYYAASAQAQAPNAAATNRSSEFNREMAKIRKTVDSLLAEGDVSRAEAYMEEQRQSLVSRGFNIRRLNQAYFAFHSTYADSPAAVSPVEGHLKDLRKKSGSLAEFLRIIGQVGRSSDLAGLMARP